MLKRKAVRSFKTEVLRYNMQPQMEQQVLDYVTPKMNLARNKSVFEAWRQVFKSELKPLFLQRKRLMAIVADNRKRALIRLLKDNIARDREATAVISARAAQLNLKAKFKYWLNLQVDLGRRLKIARRRLGQSRLRTIFKGIIRGLQNERKERQSEAANEARIRAQVEREEAANTEREEKEGIIETAYLKKIQAFRHKWDIKNLYSLLKKSCMLSLRAKKLDQIRLNQRVRDGFKALADLKRTQEKAKYIQENLAGLKSKLKNKRKQLVLVLLAEAARINHIKEAKVDNLRCRVRLNRTRTSFRGLKQNMITMLIEKSRALEKKLMVGEESLRQNERYNTQTQNDSSHQHVVIASLESALAERQIRVWTEQILARAVEDPQGASRDRDRAVGDSAG